MAEGQKLLEGLLAAGWTYAAIAAEMGVHWHTVKRWHRGDSRVNRVTCIGLASLKEQKPPPQRRYGPDAPQRKPRRYRVTK